MDSETSYPGVCTTKRHRAVLLWNPPEYSRVRYIRKLLEADCHVETISFHNRFFLERIPMLRHMVLATNLLSAWFSHKRKVIVVAFSPVPSSIVGVLLSRILSQPLVYDLYYSWVESNIDADRWQSKSLCTIVGRLLESFCLKSARFVLVDTRSNQYYFSRLYAIDVSRIVPIYGVVDLEDFTPRQRQGNELRQKLGIQDEYVIMYHGTFQKVHGIENLIQACPQIVSRLPRAMFMMVGDGPVRKNCERMVERLGLRNRFIFTGRVEHNSIPQYLAAADVWVGLLTARWKAHRTARFGMFEAMAMGKPVVTGRSHETNKLITDGKNGFLVDPHNPLELVQVISSLASESGLHTRIGRNARKLVESEYSLETMKKILLKVISRIEE